MITSTQAARYAALVMYAWDMCDANLHALTPPPDPRIALDGWEVQGYVVGQDDIVKSGDSIRSSVLGCSSDPADAVCYGYLARNGAGAYVLAIRGTDGAEEWFDDFDFVQLVPKAPMAGRVEGGFYSIFASLQYQPRAGGAAQTLADGVTQAVNGAPLAVLGHSLGAALATYATLDLVARCRAPRVNAWLFASPMPGDGAFAACFEGAVGSGNYQVFNYDQDLVPKTPPIGFSSLAGRTVLSASADGPSISADKACCHHLMSYIALLDANEFRRVVALQGTTPDDCKCAACVAL